MKHRLGRLVTLALIAGAAGLVPAAAKPRPRHRPARKAPHRAAKPLPPPKTRPGAVEGAANLAPFFESLRALEGGRATTALRVLHYGDSHTAADYWTGAMRQAFQTRFGDAGPGLLLPVRPWRGYHHAGVKEAFDLTWPSFSLRSRESDGYFGLTGGAITLPAGATYRLEAPFRAFAVHTLGPDGDQPTLLLARPQAAEAPAPLPPLLLDGLSLTQPGGQVLRTFTQPALAIDGPVELSVSVPATSRLLGVDLLTGRPGVTYEELGLNGAELFDLDKWNPDLRRALLAQAAPGLVVLAYGTNEMGRGDLDPADFRARAAALFTRLQTEAGAPILVVGPVDRGARKRRTLAALKAGAHTVVEALRLAAQDAHCAFWDARAAQGGPGSIARWRRSGWAQKDLVHLTGPGYARMGALQFEALMAAYTAYKKAVA
jgi:lysophospholipase L1-like esterase